MKSILILCAVFLSPAMLAQVTAPSLLQDASGGNVTAVASPRIALKPESTHRSVQLYSERRSDEGGQRFYLCLIIVGKDQSGLPRAEFDKVFDEKGSERPAQRHFTFPDGLATASLSLKEIKEAAKRETQFTFVGESSQVDVKLPSNLASNFLVKCEAVYGKLDGSVSRSESQPKVRPRTSASGRAAQGVILGEKMKRDGGASSRAKIVFDTKATPFGDYDAAFVGAVEQCWYKSLDDYQGALRRGKVVVEFRLTLDGRITDIKVPTNEVGEILSMLCQSAILNPQPYPRWPAAMREELGSSREIRFTFHYY